MPRKTVKMILNEVLDDLESQKFKKFKRYLSDRQEEPRIPVSTTENADQMDIADALVRAYTENNAISVAMEVLKDIRCHDLAEKLANYMKEQQVHAAGKHTMKDRHFVDVHRAELIQRVTSVAAILDDLLGHGVLNDEKYCEVNAEKTRQDKMRKLYEVIGTCGNKGKDVFYESLEKNEPYLMKDIRG